MRIDKIGKRTEFIGYRIKLFLSKKTCGTIFKGHWRCTEVIKMKWVGILWIAVKNVLKKV